MIIKLCLIAKKEVKFKDGETKIKHLFIGQDGVAYTGWSDKNEALSDQSIELSGVFNETAAKSYSVDVNEYDGKLRYRVDLSSLG